jgi:hypothetical protein
VDDDFAGGIAENFPDAFVEVEFTRRKVESSSLRFPRIDLLLEGNSGLTRGKGITHTLKFGTEQEPNS